MSCALAGQSERLLHAGERVVRRKNFSSLKVNNWTDIGSDLGSEANGIFMNCVHFHDCNDYDPVHILTHQAHVDRSSIFLQIWLFPIL